MSRFITALHLLKNNRSEFIAALILQFGVFFPDKLYLRLLFRAKLGYNLNLKKPRSFNEKLQWLKLYNRRDVYTLMVDKYTVKEYVASIIGWDHIIQTIGVWDNPDNIEWDILPSQFVLKTTHGGGGVSVFICGDKDKLQKEELVVKLKKALKSDIYKELREWPYKNVQRRIIAEPLLQDNNSLDGDLRDYKFFCFNGKVKFFKIDYNRFIEHRANYYDCGGKILSFGEVAYPPDFKKVIKPPFHLEEMIKYAEDLSSGHPFMRVDFYECNEKVFFGEITFFPASGFGKFTDNAWDFKIGEMLNLASITSD